LFVVHYAKWLQKSILFKFSLNYQSQNLWLSDIKRKEVYCFDEAFGSLKTSLLPLQPKKYINFEYGKNWKIDTLYFVFEPLEKKERRLNTNWLSFDSEEDETEK